MKIHKANHLGMCFGVRDAIALATKHAAQAPLSIFGQLVHNETVLSDLRARGINIITNGETIRTKDVMITAHGVSDVSRTRLEQQNLRVWEATCPLVQFAHRSLTTLVRAGFYPVIIGKRDHVEVRGMTEDLAEFDVILSEQEVDALTPRQKFGLISQTTQPIDRVRHLVECVRRKFPESEVRFLDTVCQPTKQRQSAAIEIAKTSDVVVVIGGAHSNNTRELVQTCERFCKRVFHVQTANDLRSEWFVGARDIGLTAGTSTPDSVINDVENRLKEIATFAE